MLDFYLASQKRYFFYNIADNFRQEKLAIFTCESERSVVL